MQGTTVVLNTFFGVVINAAQGIANQVSNQIKNFLGTMQTALNPVIIKRESKKDRARMLEASMFGNKIAFFVLAFMSIPLLIEMQSILNIWLKDVPEFAVIFCRLQLIRLIIGALTQSFFVAIGAIGNIKKYSIWESVLFISVLPASYILFSRGASPEVIYFIMILAGSLIGVVRVYFLNKLGGLSVSMFLKNIVLRSIGVFILTFGVASVPLFMKDAEIWRLLLVLAGSSGSLLLFGYYFGFNLVEKKQLKDVLQNFRRKGLGGKSPK